MKKRNKEAKAQPSVNPRPTETQPKPPGPTPEQIRRRAQEIFEARGGAPGHELDDWLLAERELTSSAPAAPPSD